VKPAAPIDRVEVRVYRVPTEEPETDGTLAWDATTMVLVQVRAAGQRGLGYTYAHEAAAVLIERLLADVVAGRDAMDVAGAWQAMVRAIRNLGRPGISSMAISAVDIALWDLKARLLDVPLDGLLGRVRQRVPIYGSGGFTSYGIERLQEQLGGWASDGIRQVKMKVGTDPARDIARVAAARTAIGEATGLFVDANGAYDRKAAAAFAVAFAEHGVSWFEEPVSSDDRAGLRLLRDRAPPGMEISAGEYGFCDADFRDLLDAGCVDVLQADATRCGGITGFMGAAELCRFHRVPLSAHTAPSVHLHAGCAAAALRHLEFFHDHVRIERLFFDGFVEPVRGDLCPDPARPGLGIELREQAAQRYRL
jgi:L-alanine-DL-glutamate epimerase-like enolase superfamily enzyme